ncbi:MAG: UDP-N-acetylmuramoyl-L-alanyl-D-glutamate--2,6-diaminopimelate ligase, partial [Desulfatiglandaceae bacterium]
QRETMKLGSILQNINYERFTGDPEQEVHSITYDSRSVTPGDLFVALRGVTLDGHRFLHEAIARGASAVLAEEFKEDPGRTSVILARNSREALAQVAAQFYGRPFEHMNLIGITGTNGKTTTSYLLEAILKTAGKKPGVIGTINYRLPGHVYRAPVTTPESLDLMRIMREMADKGVTDVVMEVSSHALDQGRTSACSFRTAVFTNLSRDHLDYHPSMEAYFETKGRLFWELEKGDIGEGPTAVINLDDPWGEALREKTKVNVATYGLGKRSHFRAEDVHVGDSGIRGTLITPRGERPFESPLIGNFNIYNILAASAAALTLGVELDEVIAGIGNLPSIPGRLERVMNNQRKRIIVDFAHTPDALAKALSAVRSLAQGRLICVFGCGGDRDKGKRREMGRVAAELSDLVLLTSDNPRSEDPVAIISQIENGVREAGMERIEELLTLKAPSNGYQVLPERGEAIRRAITISTEKDLILIAGKGHETYQIIGEEKRHFDDRKIAADAAL